MPKLSDTQTVLLSAAAARLDRSILPAPEALKAKGAASSGRSRRCSARG